MPRSLLLIVAAALLAGCAAQPAAIAPTALAPTEAPTIAAPTVAPTIAPPTAAPPSASPIPATATAEPATATPAPPTPRPEPSPPVRLEIPAIGLDEELFSVGLDANRVPVVPNHDVGWYNLSASPGQGENIVLWGHVLRFKATPDIPASAGNFDRIIVTAAMEEVPEALTQRLEPGGILIAPVGPHQGTQTLIRLTRTEAGLERKALVDVRFVPALPGIAREL